MPSKTDDMLASMKPTIVFCRKTDDILASIRPAIAVCQIIINWLRAFKMVTMVRGEFDLKDGGLIGPAHPTDLER